MAKFDLTPVLVRYLDRHLVLVLLEFLSAEKIYNKNDILQAKMEIISKTNMLDFTIDIVRQLYPDKDIKDLKKKRDEIVRQLVTFREANKDVLALLSEEKARRSTIWDREDREGLVAYVVKEYDFKFENIDGFYSWAKFVYECGQYSYASSQLHFYLKLAPPTDKNYLNVLWGQLATEILTQSWEIALDDLNKLKEYIDANTSLQSLQHRTWLIHWSLFIFFKHKKGRDLIIDMFLYKPDYLNAIQTMCPHILRYLAAAAILNKQRRSALRDVVKVIQQVSHTYRDPITEFLEHLYVNFDIEGAGQKLHECHDVICSDFFLVAYLKDFEENARLLISDRDIRRKSVESIEKERDEIFSSEDEDLFNIVFDTEDSAYSLSNDAKNQSTSLSSSPSISEKSTRSRSNHQKIEKLIERDETVSSGDEDLFNIVFVREVSALSPSNDAKNQSTSSLSSTHSITEKSSRSRSNQQKIEKLIGLTHQTLSTLLNRPPEDQFDKAGKKIACDLRGINDRQRIIAEKLINDVMYYAKFGSLNELCSINIPRP